MKYLILSLLTLFMWNAAHADFGVVSGTSHKTDNGKYPYFFDDQGHPEVWDDAQQKSYDEKMSATIGKYCTDVKSLGGLEKEYIAADENDNGLNSHPEIGGKIKALKDDMIKLSNIVVQGTGQSVSTYRCPN